MVLSGRKEKEVCKQLHILIQHQVKVSTEVRVPCNYAHQAMSRFFSFYGDLNLVCFSQAKVNSVSGVRSSLLSFQMVIIVELVGMRNRVSALIDCNSFLFLMLSKR